MKTRHPAMSLTQLLKRSLLAARNSLGPTSSVASFPACSSAMRDVIDVESDHRALLAELHCKREAHIAEANDGDRFTVGDQRARHLGERALADICALAAGNIEHFIR
jgi:hypothetical protein